MKVLVAGATGYLGKQVVQEMHSRGHQVRALVRSEAGLNSVRDAVDEVHIADATDTTALAGCCDEADAVFTAIGLVGHSGRQTCWNVDYRANLNLLDAAHAAGVGKFIYTSVVRSPALDQVTLVRAKRAFEDVLRQSGMPYTILCPNGYFSDMETYLTMARRNRGFVFGRDTCRINPIDGGDVAAAAADALYQPNTTSDLGGPDTLTHEQILRLAFDAVDASPRIIHLPLWPLRVGIALLRRLTPLRVHQLVEFPLAVLTHDVLAPTVGEAHLSEHFSTLAET